MTFVSSHANTPEFGPVFISYARADGAEFAYQLYRLLRDQQIKTWIDVSDIPAGGRWNRYIDEGLNTAKIVLVVLTPGAIKSEQVEAEWNRALTLKKHIIPLFVLDCEIPRVLSLFNYIDFRDLNNHTPVLNRLIQEIIRFCEQKYVDVVTPSSLQSRSENVSYVRKHSGYPIVVGKRMLANVEHFQNRQAQIQELASKIVEPGRGIVSVIGRSGLGKTALVSKLLYDVEHNRWPSDVPGRAVTGILYLGLYKNNKVTISEIFSGCLEMLGNNGLRAELNAVWTREYVPLSQRILALLNAFRGRFSIIFLDNLEDLLDEDGNLQDPEIQLFFDALLEEDSDIRLVLTTREPVHFKRTHNSLNRSLYLNKGLDRDHGIQMLRLADPGGFLGLKDESDEQLAKIVEKLHGVPRSLEVFAGMVQDNPINSLEEIMKGFFDHPMTENELINVGYRRLDKHARMVLEVLSVFDRPVPISVPVEVLKQYLPDVNIYAIILRLVRIHMITVVDKEQKLIALHPADRDFSYSQIPSAP